MLSEGEYQKGIDLFNRVSALIAKYDAEGDTEMAEFLFFLLHQKPRNFRVAEEEQS